MKPLKVFLLLIPVVAAVSACSLLNPPAPPSPPSNPLMALSSADEQLREQVKLAMQRAAEEAGISIQANNLVFVSRDDIVVAHALVTGFDSLKLQQPNRVADVGFAFLALPAQLGVPRGFYKVRVFVPEARAELINADGSPVAVFPLEQGHELSSSRPLIYATGCRVTLIYQQVKQGLGITPIEAAVPLDWCKLVGPTGEH